MSKGFLVCEKCEGYYELQPGESPEDFSDRCECGGKLFYRKTLETMGVKSEDTTKKGNKSNFWNKLSNRNKIILFIVVIVVIALLILAASGYLTPNKTFNKTGISFQYPGTWSDNVTFNLDKSGNVTVLGTMGDSTSSMYVAYVNLSNFSSLKLTEEQIMILVLNLEDLKPLGHNKTVIDNYPAYEDIYQSNDPVTNASYKNIRLVIAGKGAIYIIIFRTSQTDFSRLYPQFKEIENSIKITP